MTEATATTSPATAAAGTSAAVSTTPAAAVSTTPAAATTAPAAATAAPASKVDWLPDADADTVGLVGLKGWKGPGDAVKAYQHAQQFIGANPNEIVRIPGADADKLTKDTFYTKLGRPADATKYEVSIPEGVDPKTAEWAKGAFFEAGLSADQAKVVTQKWNEALTGQMQELTDARARDFAEQTTKLQKEWGAAYKQNADLIDRAATALGMDEKMLVALRDAVGPYKAMQFMHNIGSRLGEDSFVTSEHRVTGFNRNLAPAEAQARIKELRSDREWTDSYLKGDPGKKKEMAQLQAWAYPDPVNG